MYGLAYCKLDYEYMYDLDINILSVLLKAEIDKELFEFDMSMKKLAWQTSLLMNATGNFKTPVKPDKLYESNRDKQLNEKKATTSKKEVETKRADLLKTFGIK